MNPENFFAAFDVGEIDGDLAIESARAEQRWIQDIGPVRSRDNDDTFLGIESVHLDQERIKCLLTLIVTAADAVAAVAADRVDFIDKNDAGRAFLALLEHVPDPAGSDTDEHLHEIGAANREERDVGFAGNSPREQGFTRARRSDQQDPFWYSTTELLKLFRITQELDQLLYFVFGLLDASDIAEGDLIFIAREHARFGFANIQRAFAGHPDLLVIEQLDEPVIRDNLDVGIAAVPDEQGHTDQGEGNRDQDDAAPIKIRLVTALVIARRVSIGLCH